MQVLLILLDYGPPEYVDDPVQYPEEEAGQHPHQPQEEKTSSPPDDRPGNYYRQLLSSIQTPRELTFIFDGISRLLNNVHEAVNTYIPGSVMQIQFYQVSSSYVPPLL